MKPSLHQKQIISIAAKLWVLTCCFFLTNCGPTQTDSNNIGSRSKNRSLQDKQLDSDLEQANTDNTKTSNPDLDSNLDDKTQAQTASSNSNSQTSTDNRLQKTISNSAPNFQVKDIELLRNSIVSCVGPGMTLVDESMMINGTQPSSNEPTTSADGRIRFLFSQKIKRGEDIIDYERINLVESGGGSRTSTSADTISDTYLRALESIANVIAHNCDSGKELCSCATKADAEAFLTRCLPALNPKSAMFISAAEAMAKTCSDGPAGMRSAIASFIASYAFANAR